MIIHECVACHRDHDLERGTACPSCGRAFDAADYARWVSYDMPDASLKQQLAEVMRRSKGSVNPKLALEALCRPHYCVGTAL